MSGGVRRAIPSPQMLIRHDGHQRGVILVDARGEVVRRYKLNPTPNETGMIVIRWHGPEEPALLFNGGWIWHASGEATAPLPELPEPVGPARQGWYHCIPADVYNNGEGREEAVVYNPWDQFVAIYGAGAADDPEPSVFEPAPRQYNVRLMD